MSTELERWISGLRPQLEPLVSREGLPGLALGIVRDQDLVWSAGFGRADLEKPAAPDRRTLFRVASITKTLTTSGILRLRDEGRLSLDDPLHRHIPEFAQARLRHGSLEQITLRRLLCHHSGLTTEAPLPCWDALAFPQPAEFLAAIPRMEVVIPPDSAFKYSNLAFGLLGEVVGRVSGLPYPEFLKTRILDPLGMTSSALQLSPELRSRLARGYSPSLTVGQFDPAPDIQLNGLAACGQLYSTVEDLGRWISLQFSTGAAPSLGARVLKASTIEESHRPQHLEADWSVGYCLGWRATRAGSRIFHGHGGALPGYASYVLFSKPHKLGVICLANVWPHPGLLNLAISVAELLLDSGWPAPLTEASPPASPLPPDWEQFLGVYEARPRIFAGVARGDGALRLEETSLSDYVIHAPAVLEPTGLPSEFVVRGGRGAGEHIRFKSSADGKTCRFELGGFVYRKRSGEAD